RRLGRHVRDDVESAADFPAGRRAHPVRNSAALAATDRRVAYRMCPPTLIVVLGYYWRGWLYWGLVVLILSRGRLGHPPVLDAQRPLPASRRRLAWAALVLFVITFAPVPFRI